ncbi:AAA family ATPase [uncultured Rhodoblastus sp.]|uniref:AAA family ATPase n=1 Tax=uncultured Rhodoblastus sp. TaxID=543037 RepID=UPI0025CC299B|nr:AAA family ATPase [uncultured Rhodoblastus sp.]
MNIAPPNFYDLPGEPEPPRNAARPLRIVARPFRWIEPKDIPRRQWLYARHYIREYVSMTVAPGGVGKSSLSIVEALTMASGKPLLGIEPCERCRVWLWNGEDPQDEIDRRVMAAAIHYGLTREDFEGWLFTNSGRETEIVLATQTRTGAVVAVPVVEDITATLLANKIDVALIDPFVSSHQVAENDNPAIDRVAKTWGKIAGETKCAVELVHHSRKANGAETSIDDSRGASSLSGAIRSGRTLNVMTEGEADQSGVEDRRSHVRMDSGAKSNLSKPPEKASWLKLISVNLGNGDEVGVVTAWKWPDPLEGLCVDDLRDVQKAVAAGEWRDSIQAKDWVGIAVGQALRLDASDKRDKVRINAMLKIWKKSGALVVIKRTSPKGKDQPFVEVGNAV